MLSTNEFHFYFSILSHCLCRFVLARTSNRVLNRSGVWRHNCLVPYLRGKVVVIVHIHIIHTLSLYPPCLDPHLLGVWCPFSFLAFLRHTDTQKASQSGVDDIRSNKLSSHVTWSCYLKRKHSPSQGKESDNTCNHSTFGLAEES